MPRPATGRAACTSVSNTTTRRALTPVWPTLGYGEDQGRQHRSKDPARVSELAGPAPDWFRQGLEAALLAPTAVNQQKFCFGMEGESPTARVRGLGTYTRVDLGIAALHFELGSGRKVEIK